MINRELSVSKSQIKRWIEKELNMYINYYKKMSV